MWILNLLIIVVLIGVFTFIASRSIARAERYFEKKNKIKPIVFIDDYETERKESMKNHPAGKSIRRDNFSLLLSDVDKEFRQ